MPKLILIKHSSPAFITTRPAAEWHLSDEGRARCEPLAQQVKPYAPDVIITSDEPKARETGEIIASILNLPVATEPGLGEQLRLTVPWFDDYAELKRHILSLFDAPGEVVYGEESANAAYERFGAAVDHVLAQHPGKSLAISAHGTVISLFAERRAGIDPKPLWESLQTPSFVVFNLPDFTIEAVVGDPAGKV